MSFTPPLAPQPGTLAPASRAGRVAARAGYAPAMRALLACAPGAMDSPGGGEVQLMATADALRAVGVDARLLRPGEDPAGADVVHLFGSRPEHLELAEAARRRGTPTVLSTIAWFDLASYWRGARGPGRKLRACAGFLARAACPALPSWRRRLYAHARMLLPNSTAEARQLARYFGVPPERIHVVPNGADERFARADPGPFARRAGLRDFALCAGRIEPRKNQLGLLRAMRGAEVPVVVLGDPVQGHEDYVRACRREAGPNVRFVPRIGHDDPLLASAYAACACLVLPSWFETPGLAALEAGMQGVPLVLPEAGAAREYFGEHALYVRPGDARGIRRAVLAAIQRGRDRRLAALVRRNYTWRAAAEATRDAYRRALSHG